MKLPAIPFITKSVNTDFFLALIFEPDKLSAILFKEQEKALIVLAHHEVHISLNAKIDSLLIAADTVVSKAEVSLPENANLEKTIFTVPHSWIDDGKIIPDRLSQLKKISTELSLTPMGFIVSIEAIIAYLQKKEGAPISGIFVELSEETVTVYVVRGGNIIDVKNGAVDGSVEKTVEHLLGRVTKLDVLPSKIVLLHTKEAESVSQKFLSHHWTKDLSFMHLPQVTILERGFENEAIVSGVASQLNVSVKGGIGAATVEDLEVGDGQGSMEIPPAAGFGFVMDTDIVTDPPEPPQKELDVVDGEEFEFEEEVQKEVVVRHNGVEESDDMNAEEMYEEDEPEVPKSKSKASFLSTIKLLISSFFTPKSFSKMWRIAGGGRRLIIAGIILAVLIGGIYAYYAFLLRAEITISTDQKSFTQDALAISLTTDGESSFEDKTIRISTVDVEVSGAEQADSTGIQETGQKATGTVTIFNKTESSKKLEKGTIIISSNKLEFALNEDVNIASTSSFATSFSSAQAKVAASSFGKEYNIPSGTNFTIKNMAASDVFGKNDGAFSGGTKEEIQVVSQKDLTGLEEVVSEGLFDQALKQAKADLAEEDGVLSSYLSMEFVDKAFDRKVNEKATSVSLDATVLYTLGVYKRDELEKFIFSSDEFDVSDDFTLSNDDSSITLSDVEIEDDSIDAKLSFNAIFKPRLDTSKLPQGVAGKSEGAAKKILQETSGVADIKISYPFKLPVLPALLPLRVENIQVILKAK